MPLRGGAVDARGKAGVEPEAGAAGDRTLVGDVLPAFAPDDEKAGADDDGGAEHHEKVRRFGEKQHAEKGRPDDLAVLQRGDYGRWRGAIGSDQENLGNHRQEADRGHQRQIGQVDRRVIGRHQDRHGDQRKDHRIDDQDRGAFLGADLAHQNGGERICAG